MTLFRECSDESLLEKFPAVPVLTVPVYYYGGSTTTVRSLIDAHPLIEAFSSNKAVLGRGKTLALAAATAEQDITSVVVVPMIVVTICFMVSVDIVNLLPDDDGDLDVFDNRDVDLLFDGYLNSVNYGIRLLLSWDVDGIWYWVWL